MVQPNVRSVGATSSVEDAEVGATRTAAVMATMTATAKSTRITAERGDMTTAIAVNEGVGGGGQQHSLEVWERGEKDGV